MANTVDTDTTLLLRGRWLFPDAETIVQDGAIVVEGDTIRHIGSWTTLRAQYPEARVIGSSRHAVLPGFINAHSHSAGATHIQHGIQDRLLEPWLLSLAARRGTDSYLATQLAAARLLRSGVTSVVDIHSGGGTAGAFAESVAQPLRAYEQVGIRAAFGIGLKNRSYLVWGDDEAFMASLPATVRSLAERRLPGAHDVTVDDYFDIFDEFWQQYHDHPRIDLWFAPPGPQWVSEDYLFRIFDAAEQYDTNVQTHLEESIYEKHYGLRTYGTPTVLHWQDLGVLSPRLSFAHGVWLTEEEIEVLAETGAAVSHNPSSNLRLRAGIAPLNTMLDAGVTVALGMDGTTTNDNEDMWQELRLALRLHRTPQLNSPAPAPANIFHMATAGGAVLLRDAGNRGVLQAGAQADVVLIDLGRVTSPWVAPEADPLALVCYRASAGDVDTVLVAGDVVVEDGRVTTIDEHAIAEELAAHLDAREVPAENVEMVEALLPHVEAYYERWELEEVEPYTRYNSRT